MPRYSYRCSECESTFTVFHGMSEKIESCDICGEEGCLERVYDTINIKKSPSTTKSQGAAERVKDFIEESREALKEHQQEVRKEHD